MKEINNLHDLMIEQLRDLYYVEKKLDELLPVMIDKINSEDLKEVLNAYYHANEEQIMRIRQSFEPLYTLKRGEVCEAMKGMETEVNDLMKRSSKRVMDSAMIIALQHIIHYQIAGYGAVCTYAQMLGFDSVASIIHKNLELERATDRRLVMLAETSINKYANV